MNEMSGAIPLAPTKFSTNLSSCGSSRLSKTKALVDSCGSSSKGKESTFAEDDDDDDGIPGSDIVAAAAVVLVVVVVVAATDGVLDSVSA